MIQSSLGFPRVLLFGVCAFVASFLPNALPAQEPNEFNPPDNAHICIVGNTLAERMQHDGWLETILYIRYPDKNLVFRNLGFSGDELTLRLRSSGFGSPDEHLTHSQADVVFAFFGYNESFAGEKGLPKFKADLEDYLKHLLSQKYNGESAPQVVLFSPIAHEDLGSPNLPDGKENNQRLELYTIAMKEVAAKVGVQFVDLLGPTKRLYAEEKSPLTINGVHLNELGNREVAFVIADQLGAPKFTHGEEFTQGLRTAVLDKNFHWFNRYRTVDGFSIYGGRADLAFVDGQTNRVVMQRELQILDEMTAIRDQAIWAILKSRVFAIDDSKTQPFIPVKTNKPGRGPNGEHLFTGAEASIQQMKLGSNLEVNLFASEEQFPEIANPVQMAFDPKGRLWLATMPSYPHWKPKDKMSDKIVILEDTNGDGRADKSTVFADELHVPTGLELYEGGVLVGAQPDLLFLKDIDGDDKADIRERVLHGIDSADTHHAMNSFVLDPGGALYFQEGTFHHTQVETPWGPPVRSANAAVFRYEPKSSKFDVYVPYSFANPHGHVFDRWGQDFLTDGTGNVNYYATAFSGHLDFPNKHPGLKPIFNQRVRPCPATEILSSSHFPAEYQGNYLVGNVIGFHGIMRYKLSDDGSGFMGEELEPIIQSSDENFRPVDLEVGPDGAIYFCDWQNPIIGHMQHNLRDPSRDQTHGRVYRITYTGRDLVKPIEIGGAKTADLVALLKHNDDRIRYRAKIELSARDSREVLEAVDQWLKSLKPGEDEFEHHRLEALWVYQYHNVVNKELLSEVLSSPDPRARAAATRVLCYWRDRVEQVIPMLAKLANDEHPRVRLEAVRACSFFRDGRAAEAALQATRRPLDDYLRYTLGETMRQLEPYWKEAIASGAPFAVDNPEGINYILQSVTTAELVRLPRTLTVQRALLSRESVTANYRLEALVGLAIHNKSNLLTEAIDAIRQVDEAQGGGSDQVLSDLGTIAVGWVSPDYAPKLESKVDYKGLQLPVKQDFARSRQAWLQFAESGRHAITRQLAYAILMLIDGSPEQSWLKASEKVRTAKDFLDAIPLVPSNDLRGASYSIAAAVLQKLPAKLEAEISSKKGAGARFVRIELPRQGTLTLAEVQILSDGSNIGPTGKARQSSTGYGGEAQRAIDGNTNGAYGSGTQTHTNENEQNPWWEVDLGSEYPIESVSVWNRTENNGEYVKRLDGFTLTLLDSNRQVVSQKAGIEAPLPSATIQLEGDPVGGLKRSAMNALVASGVEQAKTYALLSSFVLRNEERAGAVQALSRLPKNLIPKTEIEPLVEGILKYVSGLSTEDRTNSAVRDELQLGSELAGLLTGESGTRYRKALRELGVPMIVVRPVPHLMIFDRSGIYVEAGKPVEIVFDNVDIMVHNLLIVKPGTLEKVGLEAEKMAADVTAFEKNFVPATSDVLFATKLLQPKQKDRLTFVAPSEVGDYPYVCTFPGHWRRMFGTLHVVKSLDDVPAEDLLAASSSQSGATRPFVKAWKFDDLKDKLTLVGDNRDLLTGKHLFTAVSCAQCHKQQGEGGDIGPDFAKLREKLAAKKMTIADVLTEMVEPSKVIDEQYRSVVFELSDGNTFSGVVVKRTPEEIQVRTNPLDKAGSKLITFAPGDVEAEFPSKISVMPEGLLNTMSEDEILDLLSYILSEAK